MIPRDYQEYAAWSVLYYWANGGKGNPLVVMPTGTGKSLTIARLLQLIMQMWAGQRVLVLTHVKELIEQNYDKLLKIWPQAPAGIYSAGVGRRDTMHPIIFGGIASVVKKLGDLGRFNLVFVDECHLVNPESLGMYGKLLEALKVLNPNLKVVGFTATPWKLGYGSIIDDGIFTDICVDMSGVQPFNWLITQGYLMPLIPKKTQTVLNIDGVHMRGGEFIAGELQNAVNKEDITRSALVEAMELGADRRCWLVFASGVEHAISIADMLVTEFGVTAIAVHGDMSKTERKDAIEGWQNGKYRVAVNNNVLTTGIDNPWLDFILMLRPTASPVLWVQMLGRGTRPYFVGNWDITTYQGRMNAIAEGGKKNCLVLDYAGNTRRLGPINDPVPPRKKGAGSGEAPVKECICGNLVHASARWCGGQPEYVTVADNVQQLNALFDRDMGCGYEFEFKVKIKQQASTEQLVKGDVPQVETFKVENIVCTLHQNANGKMVKVAYYCSPGYKQFVEYVAPEHPQQAMRTKARKWVEQRGGSDCLSNEDLLNNMDRLLTPTHLRVWINQKYPTILAACFDGSSFGEQEANTERPEVTSHNQVYHNYARAKKPEADDDIPFTDAEMAALAGSPRPAPNFSDMDDDIPF